MARTIQSPGVEIKEVDLSVNVDPKMVKELVRNLDCKLIDVGEEYGTLTVILDDQKFEVTSFRKDVKTYGRAATVEFTSDIIEDAKRRDFTINSLYMTKERVVIDPLQSFKDLQARKVKFVGEPGKRIIEDYLRILRYFRFIALFRKPEEKVDQETLGAIQKHRESILTLSKERIWYELKIILDYRDPLFVINLMEKIGVLGLLFMKPELERFRSLLRLEGLVEKLLKLKKIQVTTFKAVDPIRRLFMLAGENAASISKKWPLNRSEIKRLSLFDSCMIKPLDFDEAVGYYYGAPLGIDLLLLDLSGADTWLTGRSNNEILKELDIRINSIFIGSLKSFPVSAKDLMSIGWLGKDISSSLRRLERIWVNSKFAFSKGDLLKQL